MEFCERFDHLEGDRLVLSVIEKNNGDEQRLPYYYYNIQEKSSRQCIGKISVRIGHNYHSYYNGNIGYEIDESSRGHNFAGEACRMVLDVARYHGMKYLVLSCENDNIPSIKTIQSLNSIFLESILPPEDYFAYYEGIKPHNIYKLDLCCR